MKLVEREDQLAQLSDLFEEARMGSGRLVFVGGEAGVGKTTLARAFIGRLAGNVQVLWGACDPYSTPRPLGPFLDMQPIAALVQRRLGRHELLTAILDELSLLTVIVVDDAHWADEATLDALRFLGRRIASTRGLLLVTYRDDEVGAGRRLRAVLGDLATATGCTQLRVPLLTEAGVEKLAADRDFEPGHLYRITGGNAFFVTEVVASPGWTVPGTVSDAVRARVSRLSPQAQQLLNLIALAPGGLETDVICALFPNAQRPLDESTERGIVVIDGGLAKFRHELARLAVEETVPAATRHFMHLRLLESLEPRPEIAAARLAHHAVAAGDGRRVLRYAQAAGREASARGAHREAARQYREAAEHAGDLPPSELADLLSACADEAFQFEDPAAVADLRRRVVDLRRRAGDLLGEGVALGKLGRAVSAARDYAEAERLTSEAVRLLEGIEPGPELAFAYAQLGYLAEVGYRAADAIGWSSKAVELAGRVNAPLALCLALQTKGEVNIIFHGETEGIRELEESRRLALASGDDDNAILAMLNLGAGLMVVRRYPEALAALEEARAFGRERDLDNWVAGAAAYIARIRFETGRWDESEKLAISVTEGAPLAIRSTALSVVGRVLARRGHPDGQRRLSLAWEIAQEAKAFNLECEAMTGMIEAVWLGGRQDEMARLAPAARELLNRVRVPWVASELAFRLWRASELEDPPIPVVRPFALHMSGNWEDAAGEWERIGCPYEQAEALADGDEPAMRQALKIFSALGAEPAADRVRARMRRLGVRHVPSRPRASTRDIPAQLTRRQLEVLALVEAGLSDAEIATRLFITEKTAGHHVSAILHKLDVRSRTEAGSMARKLGISSQQT